MKKLRKSIAAILITAALLTSCVSALELVPVGSVAGIKMTTDGMVVAGMMSVGETEEESPAARAGILPGDVIVKIGSNEVSTASDFANAALSLGGEPVALTVERAGKTMQFTVTPEKSGDGVYQLGLWLKDAISGIGTITYYDPGSGAFGALGHGVSDTASGTILPLGDGSIAEASIVSVVKGQEGTPGELCGVFDVAVIKGDITDNTSFGVFGIMNGSFVTSAEAVEVAPGSDIKTGEATILANISGKDVKEYSINIERVYKDGELGRDMLISITDSELLEATGGIVQGMSGSPIMQDGKLVGAVTHVLVDDPAKGYAISMEKMLAAAGIAE